MAYGQSSKSSLLLFSITRVGVEAYGRSGIPNRTIFPRSCAFYLGVNPEQLKDLPLRWQRDVYFNSWSRIQTAVNKKDAPRDVKRITLYQEDGVKVNIKTEDCSKEEGMADGEPGDDDEDAATSEVIYDSKIKQQLKQQALLNFMHVREAASHIQIFVSTDSSQKESQSPQASAMEVAEYDEGEQVEEGLDDEPHHVAKMIKVEHTADDEID